MYRILPLELNNKTLIFPGPITYIYMYMYVYVFLYYLSSLIRPTLKHQRPQEEHVKTFDSLTDWYKRGIKKGPAATKFRKGACENCGSMTHKKKDCLEVHVHVIVHEIFDSDPASWAALVAQLVEHLSGIQSVVGSNPT